MKKPSSENVSKPKSTENIEKPLNEIQKENKNEDIKDESKISLTPSSTSQEKEDNLDSYPNEDDSNSNLLKEVENFYTNKKKEEPKACENTEFKEEIKKEPLKIDPQQDKIKIIPQKLFLKKKRKKTNVNINTIKKIIKREADFLLKKKKQYKKNHFYEILKVNNLDKFQEKIEITLKEEESESKDKIYYEEDENLVNNDSSDKSFKQDYTCININEAINSTSDIFNVSSTLVESLYNNKNTRRISTKTLSTTNDE